MFHRFNIRCWRRSPKVFVTKISWFMVVWYTLVVASLNGVQVLCWLQFFAGCLFRHCQLLQCGGCEVYMYLSLLQIHEPFEVCWNGVCMLTLNEWKHVFTLYSPVHVHVHVSTHLITGVCVLAVHVAQWRQSVKVEITCIICSVEPVYTCHLYCRPKLFVLVREVSGLKWLI